MPTNTPLFPAFRARFAALEQRSVRPCRQTTLAEVPGFHVLPKRWVVERTFGWLMHCRRLVRDHEQTTASAAGWIYLAMIRLMLRRLA